MAFTELRAHIEVKLDGKWQHYAAPTIKDNYIAFACINGYGRDYIDKDLSARIKPQASVKGIPEDISELTKYCWQVAQYPDENGDTEPFGAGCLTAQDLRNLQTQFEKINSLHTKFDFEKMHVERNVFNTWIHGNPIAWHEWFDDARIIFWYV